MLALLLLLCIAILYSLSFGAVALEKKDIFFLLLEESAGISLASSPIDEVTRNIILNIRLPRVLLAALVGASLAVAGATFQGLFRNPLADPYFIGLSSGAALGACLVMVGGFTLGGVLSGFGTVPMMAFAGGLAAIALVYNLARQGDHVPVLLLLLAGIAVNAFLSALVSLFIFFSGEQMHQVIYWMMGSLGAARWSYIKVMLPYTIIGFGVIYFFARELNAMLLGEETAHYLGINIERCKKIFLAAASLLVAAAVSTSGSIGFLGLIVPHMIRFVSGPDHRFLLPASALGGAILLTLADTLARTVIAPAELPVGIITALLGAPFFIYLLSKRKKLRFFN